MTFRPYKADYKDKCLEIFDSNCPKYFDQSERDMFIKWLDHQADPSSEYASPAYTNAEKDVFEVIDDAKDGIVACGGFYILKDQKEARLAWGMVDRGFHNAGFGTALFKHRISSIRKDWPRHQITMCTSQHTFQFYENLGMKVINIMKDGFGTGLHRYDMVYAS